MKTLSAILILLSTTLSAATQYHNATQLGITGVQTAWGIAHSTTGLYVSDWQADVIHKYDSAGHEVAVYGHTGSNLGEFYGPKGLAVDENGLIYVADAGNERIQVLAADGTALAEWVDPINTDTGFSPEDVALAPNGNVYVSDAYNHRILIFNRQGGYLGTWGHLAFVGPNGFAWPEGLAVDVSGNVYVADSGNGRVLEYDGKGTFIRQIGGRGIGQGLFDSPMDVAVLPDGHIFVTDNGGQRVQAFDANGTFEFWWGQNQNGVFFQDVFGMDLGPDGRVLVADGLSGNVYALSWDSLSTSAVWNGGVTAAHLGAKDDGAAAATFAIGPVPAAPGDRLCLTLDGTPVSGEWKVYSIDGRLLRDLRFDGQNPQCWDGSGTLPKGMYLVELHQTWSDGHHQDRIQKVVLR